MMKSTMAGLALACCALTAAPLSAAIATGPEVGTAIPEFTARDQNGELRDLESLRGPTGLLILFHRSADW